MKLGESVIEELWFAEDDVDESSDQAAESFAASLGRTTGLKAFPQVAQKIISIMQHPNCRTSDISRAVEEDPALAAGLLRVANSAFFAHAKAASSVQQAIVRLGQTQVKEIVYSVATMGMFKDVGGYGKSVRDHCASTGALVQYIARDVAPAHEDGLFLCGLLHDIGKLMLINSGEIDYPADNIETVLTPDSVHVFEREELGYDHAVLAGHIIAAWNMEEKISKVVAWHHQPSRAYKDEEIGPMVALLRIADKLDFEMSREDENFEEFLKNLENSSDCQYLQLKEGWLMKHWEDMYKLRLESLSMF